MTDTMIAPPASDIPTPRFRIGQRVWKGDVTTTSKRLPCPDCLDTGMWSVTTPGCSTFTATCQRCGRSASLPRGVPPLEYLEAVPTVRALTIGSVRIETDAPPEHRICYMCAETGIGSGSLYYENTLHETEEAALEPARVSAAIRNADAVATPQRIEQAIYSTLTLADTAMKAAEDALWGSWWAYRHLREDLEGYLEPEPGETPKQALEDLRSNLRFTLEYETTYRDKHMFQAVLDATRDYIRVSAEAGFPAIDLERAVGKIDGALRVSLAERKAAKAQA